MPSHANDFKFRKSPVQMSSANPSNVFSSVPVSVSCRCGPSDVTRTKPKTRSKANTPSLSPPSAAARLGRASHDTTSVHVSEQLQSVHQQKGLHRTAASQRQPPELPPTAGRQPRGQTRTRRRASKHGSAGSVNSQVYSADGHTANRNGTGNSGRAAAPARLRRRNTLFPSSSLPRHSPGHTTDTLTAAAASSPCSKIHHLRWTA